MPYFYIRCIREYNSTLYVGKIQGVSDSQYIGIGTKLQKTPKTAKTRLRRVKYTLFLHYMDLDSKRTWFVSEKMTLENINFLLCQL